MKVCTSLTESFRRVLMALNSSSWALMGFVRLNSISRILRNLIDGILMNLRMSFHQGPGAGAQSPRADYFPGRLGQDPEKIICWSQSGSDPDYGFGLLTCSRLFPFLLIFLRISPLFFLRLKTRGAWTKLKKNIFDGTGTINNFLSELESELKPDKNYLLELMPESISRISAGGKAKFEFAPESK